MTTSSLPPLLQALRGERPAKLPIWMMRQAGRHLPEYMELRARAKDFLDFCYTPSLATEATLQPVRRYGMDGAILFADILLVLDAMGLDVRFEKGVGPLVEQITDAQALKKVPIAQVTDRLSPVYETVSRVRAQLSDATTLIGFAGAPWTVALYAIEGRGKTDKSLSRGWAYSKPDILDEVLACIVEASAHYLAAQVEAGAQALMLFDSWAEGLADDVFRQIIIQPNRALVSRLRELGVTVPIIGFPRGAGAMLADYVEQTGISAVGLDTAAVPDFVNSALPKGFPVQGHLDPLLLREGGPKMDARVRELIEVYSDRPHIFNLGHGVTPEVPIKHVERVVEIVREYD